MWKLLSEPLAHLRPRGAYEHISAKGFGGLELPPFALEPVLEYLVPAAGVILMLTLAYLRERSLRIRWKNIAAERDATMAERQRVESALRESETRFKAFMDRLPAFAFIKDDQGRYTYVNKTWESRYRLDWRGKTDAELWPSRSAARFSESDRRAFESEHASEEFETLLDAGQPEHLWVMKFPLRDGAGNCSLGGIALDITEPKRKQAELEEAHMALSNAMPGVARLDTEGRYLIVNDVYAGMLGYDPAELIGAHWSITVHSEDQARARAAYARMLETGKGEFEACAMRKDGGKCFKQILMVKIVDDDGDFVGHHCFARDITERRLVDDERARLAAIVENSGDAIISRGLDLKILTWNGAAERLFGYTAAEVIGQSIDILNPPDKVAIVAQRRSFIEQGIQCAPIDTVWLAKEGRRIDVSVAQSPMRDGNGNLVSVSLVVRDITERKRTEKSLRLTQFSMDRAVDGVFWVLPSAEIVYVNDAACRLLGYERNELIGKTIPDIDPNFPAAAWPAHWEEVKQKRSFTFESDHRTRDGRLIDTEVTVNYIEYDGAEYNCAIMRDITERKQAERSLRLARFAMEKEADEIFWVLPSAEIINVNAAACRVLGFSREELIGKTVHDIDPNFPAAAWPAHWQELKEKGAFTFESDHRTKDGRLLNTEITVNYLEFEGQEYNCAIVRDITARKHAERALRASERSIRRLYEITNASELSFAERVRALLMLGCDRFDIPYGFLTRVTGEELEITFAHAPDGAFTEGARIPLSAAFCNSTMQAHEPLCYEHVGASEWRTHPGYLALGMECYMGTKIVVNETVCGTLCFLGRQPHDEPFTTAEKDFLKLMAIWVSAELERHQTHQRLRESHDRIRQIIDIDPNFIFAKDREGRFTIANKAVADAYGTSVENLIGKTDADFNANRAEVAYFRRKDREVMDTLQQFSAEESMTDATGKVRWLQTVKRPILDETGRATQVLGASTDITARKRAEDELRVSEERYRLTFEHAAVGVAHVGFDGRWLRVNQRVCDITGYCREELLAKTFQEITHPDDLESNLSLRDRFLAGAIEAYSMEKRYIRKDGSIVWVSLTSSGIYDSAGTPLHFISILIDIGDRKRTEEELRRAHEGLEQRVAERTAELEQALSSLTKTEALLHQAVDVANLGIFERDHVTHEVYYSETLKKILGLPADRDGTLGDFLSKVHVDDRELVNQARRRAHDPAGHGQLSLECRLIRRDGSTGWILNRAETFFEGTGTERRPRRTVGAILDITERKRSEEALRASEERLRAILDNSPAPIFIKDTSGRYIHVNRRFEEAFDIGVTNCAGKTDFELFGAEQARVFQDNDRHVIERDQPIQFEEVARYRDGDHTSIVNKFPLRDAQGKIIAVCGMALDITERKALENELRQRVVELREADRQKDEFIAMLGHELRNPLASLANALAVIKSRVLSESRLDWSRQVFDNEIRHLTRLVDDLLDVSRINRDLLVLHKEPLDIAEVLRSALDSSRAFIEAHRHQITVSVPLQPVVVIGDKVRLIQVFVNLLNNAAKYTPAGGRIALEAALHELGAGGPSETSRREVVMRVKDNGIGIAADKLSRLFEKFYQIDRFPGQSEGGLGLGLALVRRLVEMHGGSVEALSDGADCGSEFVVRLPAATLPLETRGSGELHPGLVDPARCRVLIVDDYPLLAEGMAMVLRPMGYEVETAFDGLEGYHAAEQHRPDLALLDLSLPGLSGIDLAKRIRQQPWGKQMLLVALTGQGTENDRDRCLAEGFDDHMAKPVDYNRLEQLLAQVAKSESACANRH